VPLCQAAAPECTPVGAWLRAAPNPAPAGDCADDSDGNPISGSVDQLLAYTLLRD